MVGISEIKRHDGPSGRCGATLEDNLPRLQFALTLAQVRTRSQSENNYSKMGLGLLTSPKWVHKAKQSTSFQNPPQVPTEHWQGMDRLVGEELDNESLPRPNPTNHVPVSYLFIYLFI